MRNNEDSYSSEEEDETIEDRGSKQEEEENDVALQMGDEVVKGCDGEAGDRVDAHVNMNDMEEDASLKEVSVVEETEMMEGGSEVVGSYRVDDVVVTSGFIKSMSGFVGKQQGINLGVVDLNRAHVDTSWDGLAQGAEIPDTWADNSTKFGFESVHGVGQPSSENRRVPSSPSVPKSASGVG
ncbi:unnamed protein product [Camellia sinensis]